MAAFDFLIDAASLNCLHMSLLGATGRLYYTIISISQYRVQQYQIISSPMALFQIYLTISMWSCQFWVSNAASAITSLLNAYPAQYFTPGDSL